LNAFFWLANERQEGRFTADSIADLMAVGSYLVSNPQFPWGFGPARPWSDFIWGKQTINYGRPRFIDPHTYLGGAAVLLMSAEFDTTLPSRELDSDPSRLGPFSDLYAYVERRHAPESKLTLRDLPVPKEFKQVFRDWAEGKVNLVGPAPDSAESGSK
jgi:hypothetical protein